MLISDWSSDVCSSDLVEVAVVDRFCEESDLAAVVGAYDQCLVLGVDACDRELLAGDEVCGGVRGEGHDAVPGGVAATAGRGEVFAVEVTELVVAGPGEAVEVGDLLASPCEQCCVVPGGDVGRPLVDHGGEGRGRSEERRVGNECVGTGRIWWV